MAIGRLAVGAIAAGAAAASQTASITIPAGSNVVLLVRWTSNQTGNHDITSMTYNGVALTQKQSVTPSGNAIESYALFVGTTDGNAHNLVVNYSPNDSGGMDWVAYENVDQAAFDNTNFATDTTNGNITQALTSNVANCWVATLAADVDSSFTAVSGVSIYGSGQVFDSNGTVTAGSNNYTINRASGTRAWMWSMFSLAPAVSDLAPSVVDTVTITESVAMMVDDNPNVNDAVSVAESVTMMVDLNPVVGEDIAVTESVTVEVVTPTDPPTIIENITVGESVTVMIEQLVPEVHDDISVAESVTVAIAARPEGVTHLRSTEQQYPLMMDEDEIR